MESFSFNTTRSILHETGSARQLGAICRRQGGRSVLIVTDPGIAELGLLDPVLPGLKSADLHVGVFSEVEADPSDTTVLNAIEAAHQQNADLIIGFGGGSSMDVAKLVALLASPGCQQSLKDVYGVGAARGERLPLIQVPTTAGTGSEVTPVAIVTTGATTKSGVVSPLLLPDLAVLDAELTTGLPPHITAATGIDAMVHAIEAYTSKIKKNPLSDMMAKEALRHLSGNIVTAVHEGSNIEARSHMLLGATLAGQAFANAPVAAVHALAYPLGGHFHIPHGLSNSLVLPHVLRFNKTSATGLYAELAPIVAGSKAAHGTDAERADQLIVAMEYLIRKVELPTRLRDVDVPENTLEKLASDAILQQRLLVNNPCEVTERDALSIYQTAY